MANCGDGGDFRVPYLSSNLITSNKYHVLLASLWTVMRTRLMAAKLDSAKWQWLKSEGSFCCGKLLLIWYVFTAAQSLFYRGLMKSYYAITSAELSTPISLVNVQVDMDNMF